MSATSILLLVTLRLGWLRETSITRLGTFPTWLLTLGIAIYIVLAGFYAFFGEVRLSVSALVDTRDARMILLQSLLAGFVEETVFRGILLCVLVRVWGKTRRGFALAVVVQAALFGALHALQVLSGVTPSAAMANVLETFVFGLWAGAFVLSAGTLWPVIVLHLASNAFILIKGLSSQWVDPVYVGYLLEAILEIPLVFLGFWWILTIRPKTTSEPYVPMKVGPSAR